MKIKDGEITLNVFDDILDGMTKVQKLELADAICMDSEVLNTFVDRLMTDYSSPCTDSDFHNARLRMVGLMPIAACDVIRALVHEVEVAKSGQQRAYDWAWKLWHAVNDDPQIPKPPSYEPVSTPSADEVMTKCGYVPVPAAPLENAL